MKIVAVYGSEHKGSTYNIAQLFLQHIKTDADTLTEYFLPRDMNQFCVGCATCFFKGEAYCPHHEQVSPISRALDDADLMIFTTPVYVMRASAQMKALLDHLAFRFMMHRPHPSMFTKTALIISTGAGGGMRGAMKDIATSLTFWGVADIRTFGVAVYAAEWSGVKDALKQKIGARVVRLSRAIRARIGRARPSIKTRALFYAFRLLQKQLRVCARDVEYWRAHGWLDNGRPWRQNRQRIHSNMNAD